MCFRIIALYFILRIIYHVMADVKFNFCAFLDRRIRARLTKRVEQKRPVCVRSSLILERVVYYRGGQIRKFQRRVAAQVVVAIVVVVVVVSTRERHDNQR